jgi:hypothetical protein
MLLDSRLFLEQFADLDDTDVQFLKPPATPHQLQTFFEECVRQIAGTL